MDMSPSDVLLAATFDTTSTLPANSWIERCLAHNLDFSQTYNENIHLKCAIPSKHLAIISCMDARLDVFQILGLQPGEAHIIQNGGGRIRDAVRSLACSQALLETKEVMIIHHTDCGFTYVKNNNQILASLVVKTGTKPSAFRDSRPLYVGEKPDFMVISDIEQSVRDDLAEYKQYPMLNQNITVRGFLYNTKTGLLKEIK